MPGLNAEEIGIASSLKRIFNLMLSLLLFCPFRVYIQREEICGILVAVTMLCLCVDYVRNDGFQQGVALLEIVGQRIGLQDVLDLRELCADKIGLRGLM